MARSKKEKKTLIERIKPAGFKDLIRKLILLVCVCVFCYSAYNLASILWEYKEMDDIMLADEELKSRFIKEIYPKYKDYEDVDILIENTDFGVG